MNGIDEILRAIFDLPWYKVLVVAIIDDGLFLLKLWPLWITLIFIGIFVTFFSYIKNRR